jgi:hypothetical protein
VGRPSAKKTAAVASAATSVPSPITAEPLVAPSVDHEDDVRQAFQLALLQQLQAPEVSASVLDVARKFIADRETARQWSADRADLELQAESKKPLPFLADGTPNPEHRMVSMVKKLPFPKC